MINYLYAAHNNGRVRCYIESTIHQDARRRRDPREDDALANLHICMPLRCEHLASEQASRKLHHVMAIRWHNARASVPRISYSWKVLRDREPRTMDNTFNIICHDYCVQTGCQSILHTQDDVIA